MMPKRGYGINWKRIGYARKLRAKGKAIDPVVRRKLLASSLIREANAEPQRWEYKT